MAKRTVKKIKTDDDVKRKAAKLVIVHLKKKIAKDFPGKEYVSNWIEEMEELLGKDEFVLSEYHEKRHAFNDAIERTLDYEMRSRLRDSWYSLWKALDKKGKQNC